MTNTQHTESIHTFIIREIQTITTISDFPDKAKFKALTLCWWRQVKWIFLFITDSSAKWCNPYEEEIWQNNIHFFFDSEIPIWQTYLRVHFCKHETSYPQGLSTVTVKHQSQPKCSLIVNWLNKPMKYHVDIKWMRKTSMKFTIVHLCYSMKEIDGFLQHIIKIKIV